MAVNETTFKKPTNWIGVSLADAQGQAMQGISYNIHFADGAKESGKLSTHGDAQHRRVSDVANHVEYELPVPQKDETPPPLNQISQALQRKNGWGS